MDKTHAHPTNKDAALLSVGATSKKTRKKIARHVEFVQVKAGRALLARGAFTPTVLVGVAGTVLFAREGGSVAHLSAPFVVDFWAADQRRISGASLVSESPTTLLVVDWRSRDVVYDAVPELRELSIRTRQHVEAATAELVIDLTEQPVSPTHNPVLN